MCVSLVRMEFASKMLLYISACNIVLAQLTCWSALVLVHVYNVLHHRFIVDKTTDGMAKYLYLSKFNQSGS